MVVPAQLCSTCVNALNHPTGRDHHQTLDALRQSVLEKCYVCSSLWNLHEQRNGVWEESSWTEFRYVVDIGRHGENSVDFRVIYNDPVGNSSAYSTFRLVNPKDPEYEPYLSFVELDETTSSPRCLDLAYSWFESCCEVHSECNRSVNNKDVWLPTRLIDIGADKDAIWRLRVVARDGPASGPYMTLSYRWGSEPSIQLLQSNVNDFRQGKPIKDLPRTFRDMITVARRFSVRYIWIDALCIIQDSTEDWATQLATMRDVYASSVCNVAASASSDPAGGLFRLRQPALIRPAVVTAAPEGGEPKTYYLFNREYWSYYQQNNPLYNRGWVFQEWFLAPRVLYFTRHQMLWECMMEHKSEGFPRGLLEQRSDKHYEFLWRPDTPWKSDLDTGEAKFSFGQSYRWEALVRSYSKCSFTIPTDRLPAFSGIAKLFQEITDDIYIAGLWKSRFVHLLDWKVPQPGPRSTAYLAPSWSWASVESQVYLSTANAYENALATLVDIETIDRGSDPTSGVLYGRVTLRALLFAAEYLPWRLGPESETEVHIKSLSATMTFYPDTVDDAPSEKRSVFCMLASACVTFTSALRTSEQDYGAQDQITCVILEKHSSDKPNTYRRIGQCTMINIEDLEQHYVQQVENDVAVLRPDAPFTEFSII
ncbi:hypothetical protein FDECE_9357 [Fusarium decemcellulare]|nr:hypothetical protein FDECE_9357 [Fusarium decemcellulare]